MTRQQFISWLQEKEFVAIEYKQKEIVYEKNDTRYIVRIQSFGRQDRIVGNKWSSIQTWKYSKRFINTERKLDYRN